MDKAHRSFKNRNSTPASPVRGQEASEQEAAEGRIRAAPGVAGGAGGESGCRKREEGVVLPLLNQNLVNMMTRSYV